MKFKLSFCSVLLVFPLIASTAGATDENTPYNYEALTKNQPKDVVKFIKRLDDCAHWSGEEGYDEARRKEINAAIAKLKCERIERDGNSLKKKYKDKKQTADVITKAIKSIP
jgi:hypothetical protein